AGARLIVHRMAVHDRERRWLDHAASGTLGDRLPRIAFACGVEIDLVRPNRFGLCTTERPERVDALDECRLDAVVGLLRGDAGDGQHLPIETGVRGADRGASENLQRGLVPADERAETV